MTGLRNKGIITESFMSELRSLHHSNFAKATKLLNFLKDCRTDADYDKVVDVLRRSCCSKAADIFEQERRPLFLTPHAFQGSSVPVSRVANMLHKSWRGRSLGKLFEDLEHTFGLRVFETWQPPPVHPPPAQKIQLANKAKYVKGSGAWIAAVLDAWVSSRSPEECTVQHLSDILRNHGGFNFTNAAAQLLLEFPSNPVIVHDSRYEALVVAERKCKNISVSSIVKVLSMDDFLMKQADLVTEMLLPELRRTSSCDFDNMKSFDSTTVVTECLRGWLLSCDETDRTIRHLAWQLEKKKFNSAADELRKYFHANLDSRIVCQ